MHKEGLAYRLSLFYLYGKTRILSWKHLREKSHLKMTFLICKNKNRLAIRGKSVRMCVLTTTVLCSGDGGTWFSILSRWHWLYLEPVSCTGPLASYAKYIFTWLQAGFRILVLPKVWQPISRYTAVGLLHILLGIALSPHKSDLGFTDKARLSLMCYHIRRLETNRTHVQRYRHLSFYECSRYICVSPHLLPIDRRPGS